MQVKEIMTTDPHYLGKEATLQDAARMMEQCDCGMVPISEGDRLIGIVTDRDLAVRGIAKGLGPDEPVTSCMTNKVLYCFQDDDVPSVTHNMEEQHVQRLIVLDSPESKRLCGIVSMSDIAQGGSRSAELDSELAQAVSEASQKYPSTSIH